MFSHPSSTLSVYVCLRCHLRLARRNLHALSTTLPQPSCSSVSRSRSLHSSPRSQFTITREPVGSDGPDARRTTGRGQHHRPQGGRTTWHESWHGGGQQEFRKDRVKDSTRLRGKKGGQQVREDAETLSVNALGKPTEVIVLRDTPPSAEQEAAKQKEREEEEHAVTRSCRETLLTTLEQEDVPLDQDTVNQQLDALWSRTRSPNSERLIIAQKEFLQLGKIITKRYSIKQLDAYINQSKTRMSEQSPLQSQEAPENLIANKSPDLHFRPWICKPSAKPKRKRNLYKRANVILKNCWEVEITEDVGRLGEIFCTLPKSGIKVLSAGKPSFIDEIIENRQAQLDIDGSKIRITADKASAIYALEDINRLWTQHAVKLFPLVGAGQPILFRPEDVALVASLTRTTMNYANNNDRKTVAITGIGNDSVEDAFRALLALIDVRVPMKSAAVRKETFLTVPGTTDAVMQEISELEALPYRDRSRSLGRLCSPNTQTQREDPRPDLESTHSSDKPPTHDSSSAVEHGPIAEYIATTRHWLQPMVPNVIAPFTDEAPTWAKFWNTRSNVTFSVSLGSVVHPRDPDSGTTPAAEPSHHARFLRRVPGFPSLLPHLFWDHKDAANILSFRLLHDPWRSSGPALPDIRLDFEIKSETRHIGAPSKVVDFKGLHLISRDLRAFLMLPSHAVDLCFQNQETYHASNEYLETQPEIKTFIESTKSNILADNGTLRSPPSVSIHIPSSFIGHGKQAASTNRRKKEPDAGKVPKTVNDTGILVDYYFAGVEHIQAVGYTFGGYPVRYTSVDGGRLGGKYGDLEIFMPKLEEQPNRDDEAEQREAFVRTAFELVNLVDTAAQGRLERPGRKVFEDEVEDEETDNDQKGVDQRMPEDLCPKPSQSTPVHDQEIDASAKRNHDELENAGDDATIVSVPEKSELDGVGKSDASVEATPVVHSNGLIQLIEVRSDDCSSDQDQAIITKPFDAEHSGDPEPERRAAASG